MRTKFWLVILLGFLISLPALQPFLKTQYFHLHDWTHVARLVEMDQALQDGHFPVRWSRDLGYGYGMPQFNFYAPLPYYLAEIFHLLGASFIWSIKLLVIFNFLVSFVVMYYLVESLWGRWAGLVGAAAFIYAPYRAVDTYVRGAFGELTAITFIALALWCLARWIRQPSKERLAWASLAIGGLILSHNLVAMLALPILLMFTLAGILVFKRKIAAVITAFLMFLLGTGVAAFYAIPALGEKGSTHVDALTTGFSDYHQHFLYLRQFFQNTWGYGGSISGPEDDISFYLGFLTVGLAITGGLTLLAVKKRGSKISAFILIASGAVIIFSMLMSAYKMQWFWDLIPIMKYIQFPWRYLSIIIVFLSLAAGAAMRWIPQGRPRYAAAATVIILAGLIFFYLPYFKPEAYLTDNNSLYYTDKTRIQKEMSGIIPDFLPKMADPKNITPPVTRFETTPEVKSMTVNIDRTQEFAVTMNLDKPATFSANIYYFPGWSMYLNGKKQSPEIDPQSGIMKLTIREAGLTNVAGKFEETPLRAMADLISVISLFICGYILLPIKKSYA
jgi:4-amino-4-deoxy-L-arabinose transferase-like glycosyltransferase